VVCDIPGRGRLLLSHAVFDFNGTLALDGAVSEDTRILLQRVMKAYAVVILTADTFGTATEFARAVGATLTVVKDGEEKKRAVIHLQEAGAGVVAVGNGVNDAPMFTVADLAIGVLGGEGAAMVTLAKAHLVVKSIDDALGLLIEPRRLIATLRT
jgi:P-type E1-E2 ATPase